MSVGIPFLKQLHREVWYVHLLDFSNLQAIHEGKRWWRTFSLGCGPHHVAVIVSEWHEYLHHCKCHNSPAFCNHFLRLYLQSPRCTWTRICCLSLSVQIFSKQNSWVLIYLFFSKFFVCFLFPEFKKKSFLEMRTRWITVNLKKEKLISQGRARKLILASKFPSRSHWNCWFKIYLWFFW